MQTDIEIMDEIIP